MYLKREHVADAMNLYPFPTCKLCIKAPADPGSYDAEEHEEEEEKETAPLGWIEPNHMAGVNGTSATPKTAINTRWG